MLTDNPQILCRLPAVIRRVSMSRSSIYAAIARNEFPAPIKLGARSVAWVESEISEFIDKRIAASRSVEK